MTEQFSADVSQNEQQINSYSIETVRSYDPALAADIGRLMHELDPDFSEQPVSREKLVPIINDPERAQLIAIDAAGKAVGAATMNTLLAVDHQPQGWLEDFVVDESVRGSGVAADLYAAMMAWSRERGLTQFSFGTETDRQAAVAFYQRRGAVLDPHIKHLTYVLDPTAPRVTNSNFSVQTSSLGSPERRHIAIVESESGDYASWLTLNTLRGAGKEPEGWFDNLTVHPKWMESDAMAVVWQSAVDWAQQQGLTQISFALDERHPAMGFCRQQGSEQDETALHYTQATSA